MKQKSVLVLSVVTAAALLLAGLALREPGTEAAPTGRLLPDLSAHINEVTEVHLEKAGKALTLKRDGGQWKLVERGGFPVKVEQVKELAMRLADLEIEERKTALKANHKKLGVEWPSTATEDEAQPALVTLKDAAGKELASVVVGNDDYIGGKPKVFVRPTSADQVYLCAPRGALQVSTDTSNWIESEIVKVANDRMQSVSIEHADGEKVEIDRSAVNHTQFVVTNVPIGASLKYEGVANAVAQSLGYGLSLEDVRPAAEVDFAKEPLARSTFRCVDGLELDLQSAKFEDKTWVKVTARFVPPPAGETTAAKAEGEAAASGETPPAEAKDPAAPAEAEKKDVGKEVEELNTRLAPWVFAIPEYKSEVLLRRMKDLLAEPEATPEMPAGDGGLGDALEKLGVPESVEPTPAKDDEVKAAPGGEKKPE